MTNQKFKQTIESYFKQKINYTSKLNGGCIANAYVIKLDNGQKYFGKEDLRTKSNLLKEKQSLELLASIGVIRIPKVIFATKSILILEWIEIQRNYTSSFFKDLGNKLALLHQLSENNYFGVEDNQFNSWSICFCNMLKNKIKICIKLGYFSTELENLYHKLLQVIPEILSSSNNPCLVHGDLWHGNFIQDETGKAVLIDPNSFYADREFEFGILNLFGGFDQEFYQAYTQTYPLKPGAESRIKLYKLYHLINHLNLFGAGYYPSVISCLKNVLFS